MNLLKILWRRWLVIAQAVGNFQAQVILTIFYLIILLPVGFLIKLTINPFAVRLRGRSNFKKWEHSNQTLEQARRQY